MYNIGQMPMPADFKYADVLRKGKPAHGRLDDFSLRHPRMDPGKRAKIFAPFDALRGFNFAILAKQTVYVPKPELSPERLRTLNRQLDLLRDRTRNTRLAREHPVTVTATYFFPCDDPANEAFGRLGQIRAVTGVCQSVDPDLTRTLCVGGLRVSFGNLLALECAACYTDFH